MEAMKKKGCNNYKTPHMKKATLERVQEQLPTSVPCPVPLLDEAEKALAPM